MTADIRGVVRAAEHLQRPEEAWSHALATVPTAHGAECEARRREAYDAFLLRRAEVYMSLPPRFDGLAAGWHRAAVRLFGERAAEALDAAVADFGDRLDWPGVDCAERTLMCAMERREGDS